MGEYVGTTAGDWVGLYLDTYRRPLLGFGLETQGYMGLQEDYVCSFQGFYGVFKVNCLNVQFIGVPTLPPPPPNMRTPNEKSLIRRNKP